MSDLSPTLMPSNRDKALAWGVHLFTASGALWGLLGIISIMQQEWKTTFLLFMIASFVDGVDGLLARRFKVKGVLPDFDGALLDNILDYLTYVILPALFIYNYAGMLPVGWELFGASLMTLASAYQFCQADAKTDDHSFKGFPSYWNVVVFYLFLLQLSPWANLAVIVVLCILVFVPIRYAYPTRMMRYQQLTITLSLIWSATMLVLWLQLPNPNMVLVYGSLSFIVYYVGISLYMMWEKRRLT